MKAMVEIFALLLLFLLFRKVVVDAFPVKSADEDLNEEGLKALKTYRRKYLLLFWGIGFIITIFWLSFFYKLFHYLRLEEGFEVLVVSRSSLFLPSLVLGLLIASYIARWLNDKLQPKGYSVFFEDYREKKQGFDKRKLKVWHIIAVVMACAVMLSLHYASYLKTNGERIVEKSMFKKRHDVNIDQVLELRKEGKVEYIIELKSGEEIFTKNYSGDKESFVELLKRKNP